MTRKNYKKGKESKKKKIFQLKLKLSHSIIV